MISTMPLPSVTFVFFWPRCPREFGNLTSVHFALTSGSRDVTSDTCARSHHLAVTSAKSQHLAVTAARQLRPRDHPDVKANCFDVKHNSEQMHITLGPRLLISQLRGNQILLARNLDCPILMKSSVWAALSDFEEIKPGLLLVSVFLHEVQGPKQRFVVTSWSSLALRLDFPILKKSNKGSAPIAFSPLFVSRTSGIGTGPT